MSSTRWDREVSSVCHRLDIGLVDRPPNLDDVAAIPGLKTLARNYLRPEETRYLDCRYASAHDHVTAVARRLTAALFYFEEDKTSTTKERCTGYLRCRLSAAMMSQFEHLVKASPAFRLHVSGSPVSEPIKPVFDLKAFSAEISFNRPPSDKWVIEIHMYRWPSWERISGLSLVEK